MDKAQVNLIPNPNFSFGEPGGLPDQWAPYSAYPLLMPQYQLVIKDGQQVLMVCGNGNENCVGWLASSFSVEAGHTYRMRVRFHFSEGLDPQKNLVFSFWETSGGNFNEGIFNFKRLDNGEAEGVGQFYVPGAGQITGEVRIVYKLNKSERAWISEVSLTECEAIPQRNVRVACTQGQIEGDLEFWARALVRAGE